eukprot:CAMPEP_0201693660 /NCGR_PEP_ID=MMETSP0578-20130828/6183_1 /ASSEMBLY_ACC=CAM_ASM_000663 /TAXON_ID=267565 /ORGANISM="Skeletonema grethea, Strain CCMP 1804" /LENGTH=555 /DNA_ID=CAMNT_0048179227 /DNA_START=220 /DNA_END=1887 /DNA_ORIENTATION=+
MTNNNDNDNTTSSSSHLEIIASQSKSMLNSLLPTTIPLTTSTSTTTAQQTEGRNTKISPTNSSSEEEREGISSSQSYQSLRYAHLQPPATTTNSPSKSSAATSSTTIPTTANYTTITTKTRQGRRCYRLNLERPFNIHCEQSPLEYGDIFAPWSKEVRPVTVGPTEYCPPRHLGGDAVVWRRLLSFNTASVVENKKKKHQGGEEKEKVNTGWRQLTETELKEVQRLGEVNDEGEYAFATYDLTHVKKSKNKDGSGATTMNGSTTATTTESMNPTNRESDTPLHQITPSTSIDSTSTTESNPKSATIKANETARLFRRSELSLRDKAEEQARIDLAEKKARKAERKAREKEEMEALKGIKGAKGISKRMGKRASLNGKKLVRKLSSMGGSSTSSSSSARTMSGSNYYNKGPGIYEGGATSRRKLVSTQAGMIEKAKDLIDEESEDEYDGEKYDDSKKITNMSLFIVGEYDVLNDLCLDGGKRLKNSKDLSDLEVLLQNEPCPPPNRWVRKTGWGKCNPSSMYAECPPEDFDWESYLNKDGPVKVNPVPRPVMVQKS